MIFVDTWAWLALAYARDPYHLIAKRQHIDFRSRKPRYLTTDYVLAEFNTTLFRSLNFAQANAYASALLNSVTTNEYQLVSITPARFQRAWELRQKFSDKPGISFVDLTSIVVMQELEINDIFTGDAHFQQVNLGFQLHPGPST